MMLSVSFCYQNKTNVRLQEVATFGERNELNTQMMIGGLCCCPLSPL